MTASATTTIPASARTAMARSGPSVPARSYVAAGLVNGTVLDYGCGRGADLRYYRDQGIAADGYDPFFLPVSALGAETFDTITCTFVLNVLESRQERLDVLRDVHRLLRPGGRLCVAVRSERDISLIAGMAEGDGIRTASGTYQHGFGIGELYTLLLDAGFTQITYVTRRSTPLMMTVVKPTIR